MLGPSGSGKTTTLRLIAGFERPDAGTVELAGADVSGLPPYARDVNTVFQDYALFPHMTVGGERRVRAAHPQGAARRAAHPRAGGARHGAAAGARRPQPAQLSGGQRQRVALARAIVNRPKVLLLDEPLGALDLKLRQEMQVELKRIQQEVGITFVYVTHDQEEALTMSDRLAVFNAGRIEQIGAPADVYEHPASEFIAGFVGVSNVLDRGGRRFTVRPEKVQLLDGPRGGLHCEAGTVRDVAYAGMITRYLVDLATGGELQVVRQNLETSSQDALEQRGRRVTVGWRDEHTYAIPERDEGNRDEDESGGGRAGRGGARRRRGLRRRRREQRLRRRRRRPEGPKALEKLGEGEGEVDLIAWAGYVEDGSTDPKVDWVSDFEKETGCHVNVKVGNTSDEMVTLMRTGNYDGVSASGDATLRLIAGGDVAPVNTDLVPNYADVFDGLKDQDFNSVDGQMYGIPHGRGANLLMWRTDKVKPAPDSWWAVFDENSALQGQGHGLRQPDLHRRRGDLPEGHPARPEDRQPLRARRQAVHGRGRPAQEAARDRRRVLVGLHEGAGGVRERRLRDRHHLAGDREPARGRQGADQDDAGQGGRDRLVGHVDDLLEGQAPELHVHVDGPHRLAEGQRGGGGVVRRGARPTRRRARRPRSRTTATSSTPRTRTTSPRSPTGRRRARSAATTAERSARTTPSGSRPGPRSRAERQHSGDGPALRLTLLLAGPIGWLVVAYLGSLAVLFVAAFWRLDTFSGQSSTSSAWTTSGRCSDGDVYRDIALRTVGMAAAVTVTDALLAFPIAFFMAKVARRRTRGAARGRRADAAVGELPGQGLRLADHPGRGRDPELVRSTRSGCSGPGFGLVATWLVFSYLWLPS